jgi:hypothetical protein
LVGAAALASAGGAILGPAARVGAAATDRAAVLGSVHALAARVLEVRALAARGRAVLGRAVLGLAVTAAVMAVLARSLEL